MGIVAALTLERTERLALTVPAAEDLEDLFALHSDPAVWEHLPSGRHTDPAKTEEMLGTAVAGWQRNRLDYWVARLLDSGELAGMGGASVKEDVAWNLYYRLAPTFWGQGLAQEIIIRARAVAGRIRPDLPHIAFMLEENEGSWRSAERAGLRQVWRGPDHGNPDPGAIRLIYSDRDVTDEALAVLTR